MGHFSILTVSHDELHRALSRPDSIDRLKETLMGHGTFHGIPDPVTRYKYDRLDGFEVAFTAHNDTCPTLVFSHGHIKGQLGEMSIGGPDTTTLEQHLILAAKRLGYVIYKKPEKE